MDKKVFHVISNTHWDREWRYPFQKNRQMLVDMIDNVLEILEQEPEYRAFHLDSQSIVLKDYLEIRPEKKGTIKKFVEAKRLLVGPWYILPDEFQVGGENLIRNLLLGHKVAGQNGGVSKIGYSPFSWGQISQLPQIYKQFDIDLIMFYRGVNSIDSPKAEFLWEGADGEKMVTSRFSTMPRYNFYFYIYRPVIHNEAIPDVEYKWSKGGMPFHFAGKDTFEEDYSIIVPLDSYYPENIKPSVEKIIRDQAKDFTTEHVIWMEGHDSSGPNAKTARIIKDIKTLMPGLEVRHSTLEEYADAVLKSVDRHGLKTVKGERRSAQYDLRSGNLYGYTTSARMYLKQKNYETEKWLQYYAEPFNAFSSLLGRDIRDNYLNIAWELLIQNSAHDSIGGCSLDEIHDDMMMRYNHSIQISRGVFERALKYIAKNIDSSSFTKTPLERDNIFLTAFNPGNYRRRETVEAFIDIPKEFDKGSLRLVDSTGNELKAVILAKEDCQPVLEQLIDRPMYFEMTRYRTLLEMKDIPPFGLRQFKVIPEARKKKAEAAPLKKTGKALLENEYLKVKINADGSLNLLDKENNVTYKNLGYFVDEGEGGHAWTHESVEPVVSTLKSRAEITKIEDNPLRTRFSIKHIMRLPKDLKERRLGKGAFCDMPVGLTVTLGKNSKHLEFGIELENTIESHRLRMLFPTGLKAAKNSFGEGQFDVVKRSIERPDTGKWVEQPMYDYPMHHFVDLSDGLNGCAIMTEGLKEYEAFEDKERTVAVTLLRGFEYIIAPSSRQDYAYKKGSQCPGVHKFHIAFYPHKGGWAEGRVFEQALTFANPVSLVQSGASKGSLKTDLSFIEITPKELVFSALKTPEDGEKDTFILRLYNPTERKITGKVSSLFNFKKVEEVTLEEKAVRQIGTENRNSFTITAGKKKIVTLRITFGLKKEGLNV
ncbi:MAG: hypothetical protein HF314_16580 [Ignavibacteria bacterium]|jgi:alpha-mannosidase|nr:hypothetical protein [Ignavibacteria bacterium]MCU7504700.1 hypothetical protein [Ignavibacteria bacterium]MCU7516302.1 hypothetical protein [Ignavibacteria bacterium]